ncbi:MAG: zf-HC2 domain-containing protein [Anaerolineae bacterium]|jgi:hypothetical protein|nr:zf-HC2 domain-containing protein [Anaerolineae bacterium]MDX9830454.1 zf-HC2 domain-containing protein [Anaerolineae bacterium]
MTIKEAPTMGTHPDYYRDLLRRRFAGDPSLTPAERKELDLHLLICPECNYDYARMLLPSVPGVAEGLLRDLEGALTAELVAPYLHDLARARYESPDLEGFQELLWRYVCSNREALGRFRLAEAEVWRRKEDS